MNAPDRFLLPDTQSLPDIRALAIQRVGVSGLRYPVQIRTGDGAVQPTVATLEMTVGLPAHVKGTHMSRFVEVMERSTEALDLAAFGALAQAMCTRLQADSGRIAMRFPYFIRKTAPVSGVTSLLDYEAAWEAECIAGRAPRLTLQLTAPVTSLCPCSKTISDYGAHNQRSHITIEAELQAPLSIEALARIAEDEASCEVFGLLKRPDEKWVTERAYDNPKFVEDLVRDIALRLMAAPQIGRFRVRSENFESIHNHSALAEISGHGGAASA